MARVEGTMADEAVTDSTARATMVSLLKGLLALSGVDDTDMATADGSAVRRVVGLRIEDTLEQMLTVLRKIEFHLALATDTKLEDQDVGG